MHVYVEYVYVCVHMCVCELGRGRSMLMCDLSEVVSVAKTEGLRRKEEQ